MKLIILILLFVSFTSQAQTLGSITDARDGQTYRTVSYADRSSGDKIIIMAENLNYMVEGAVAYDNDETNRDTLGLLYTWILAKRNCPLNWHLPNDGEWEILINIIGDNSSAGLDMKSKTTWSDNGNGSNNSKFNAFSGGYQSNLGGFYGIGNYGAWWSSSVSEKDYVRGFMLHNNDSKIESVSYSKSSALSVRCVKNEKYKLYQ